MYRKYPPIYYHKTKKNSSRDTIPLTQVSVADLDPGSGIGFFQIFDPKTHIFESLIRFLGKKFFVSFTPLFSCWFWIWRQVDKNLDRCLFPVCLIDGCAVKSDEMTE
jgi:hypothetical protein